MMNMLILVVTCLTAYQVQVGNSRTVPNMMTQCTQSDDCSDGYEDFNTLVSICNTTTGICDCSLSNCFVYNNQTNHCDLKACHALEELEDGKILCVNHGGKSKRTALMLNIIAFTGATNFYLGNHVYGSLQLALCLACIGIIASRIVCCCNLCCLICRMSCADKVSSFTGKVCCCCTCSVLCCQVTVSLADILSVVVTAIEVAWMVVDYVQIGSNGKIDGNGCYLNDDTINLIQGIVLEVAKGL